MNTYKRLISILAVLLAAALSGCGGAGRAEGPAPAQGDGEAAGNADTVVETGYITVTDGTRLRYHMQRLREAPAGPVIMQYDGYDAGTGTYFSDIPAVKAQLMQMGYSILGVSARGTGCSSGEFNLFDPQRAIDGAEAVEWAAIQPWSDGNIGMIGYSYPGIMQLLVAGQRPTHLRAIAPSNVVFDLYRDVGAAGGILNAAFATLFTVQQQAPGALGLPEALAQADPECAINYAVNRTAYQSFIAQAVLSPHIDGDFDWIARSAMNTAAQIEVPVLHINYWQDEQTGSRIGGLLEAGGLLDVLGLDKTWSVLSNGNHDLTWGHPLHSELLIPFYEHYLRGVDNAWPQTPHIQVLHELSPADLQPSWISSYQQLPAPRAVPLYLQEDGSLSLAASSSEEASQSYLYPSLAPSTNPLPDSTSAFDYLWQTPGLDAGRLVWTTPMLEADVQTMGSASFDVWLSSTANDTDLQATITEVRADGQELYVARGWLRASKRALDEGRSTATRPFHLHTEASVEMLVPGEPTYMRLEIFPFAHRFRAGSAIRVVLDPPYAITGDWGPFVNPTPAQNTVWHDQQHASRLVLGVLADSQLRPEPRACGDIANQPCRASIAAVPDGSILIH